ncbi:MAG: hypothetical protein ACR2L1_06315 [Pyrinomonadaceae bacterium]
MLKISDKKFFCEILADALVQTYLACADKNLRELWINAFAQAAATILEGDTAFFHWDPHEKLLLVWSAETNEIHRHSSRDCRHPAFDQSVSESCRHYNGMSLLIENYYELQRKPGEIAQIDFADAVFFDSELTTEQKVDLLISCVSEGRCGDVKPHIEALQKHIAPDRRRANPDGEQITRNQIQ